MESVGTTALQAVATTLSLSASGLLMHRVCRNPRSPTMVPSILGLQLGGSVGWALFAAWSGNAFLLATTLANVFLHTTSCGLIVAARTRGHGGDAGVTVASLSIPSSDSEPDQLPCFPPPATHLSRLESPAQRLEVAAGGLIPR